MALIDRPPRLLLGITGSVGAALMPEAVLWLRQNLLIESIDIVLSPTASTMVSSRALAAISGRRVYTDSLKRTFREPLHINLTERVDALLIMPATANILAKAAQGIADDLISSCVLSAPCPVVFVPSMKSVIWEKPAVRRAVSVLRSDGHEVLEPTRGYSVSSGDREIGGMLDIASVFSRVTSIIASADEQFSPQLVVDKE